jgi:CubicO group peptidase (beta-lactamase class C family)
VKTKVAPIIHFIIIIIIVAGCNSPTTQPAADAKAIPDNGIISTELAGTGMDSVQLTKMTQAIIGNEYPNIHSVLISKNGKLVYERYFSGNDELLGKPLGLVNHGRNTLHDIRSITKSIVSACIGIAIANGHLKSVDQKIWDYLPEYSELNKAEKATLSIKHLLTMTSGLEWNENIPYTDPMNSELQMGTSADPVQYVLTRKSVHLPGAAWNYSGGNTQVLAAIIKKASGMEVDEYAKKYLFDPLGISNYHWIKFPETSHRKNIPMAASGLRLRSEDLLKFGLLYLDGGIWNGKHILPLSWVTDSHRSHITRENAISGKGGYGYQFWIWQENINDKIIHLVAAVGNGDQRIFFDHKNKLLVVTTAGNYNQWTIKKNTTALLKDFIYPALINY